jgi:undecaprenyl-diphosphatase
VVVLYWKRFFQSIDFYFKLLVGFLPAAVLGFLLNDYIDAMLENVIVVAASLMIGGIILLFVDTWFKQKEEEEDAQELTYLKSFVIGCFQVIAMIPGVSRSAATIIGGLSQHLNRKSAAEFSFFLAVPTMLAATGKKLYDFLKEGNSFSPEEIKILAIGNVVAFVVALLAIKTFIGFLNKNGFRIFGWYRIVVGLAIIILLAVGYELKVV